MRMVMKRKEGVSEAEGWDVLDDDPNNSPSQALSDGLGLGLRNVKPKPTQAKPEHH
jgi:hypothetical protein